MPSTPYGAKGLLIAAIEDNDPVIFFEPKRIYNGLFDGHYDRPTKNWAGNAEANVPDGSYRIDLSKARIVRKGEALTILCSGTMGHVVSSTRAYLAVHADVIASPPIVPSDLQSNALLVRQ